MGERVGGHMGGKDPLIEDLESLFAREATRPVDVASVIAGGVQRAERSRRRRRVWSGVAGAAAVLLAGGWFALLRGAPRAVETTVPARTPAAVASTASSPGAKAAVTPTTAKTPGDHRATPPVAPRADLAVATLSVRPSGGPRGVAYFGKLAAAMSRLSGQVTFAVSSDYLAAHREQCVLTVVFDGVSGSTGAVYAQGLENANWGAAELPPSQQVSSDKGRLHQQLIVPPAGAGSAQTWRVSALLQVDGRSYTTSGYTLTRLRQSPQPVWRLGATQVGCNP